VLSADIAAKQKKKDLEIPTWEKSVFENQDFL